MLLDCHHQSMWPTWYCLLTGLHLAQSSASSVIMGKHRTLGKQSVKHSLLTLTCRQTQQICAIKVAVIKHCANRRSPNFSPQADNSVVCIGQFESKIEASVTSTARRAQTKTNEPINGITRWIVDSKCMMMNSLQCCKTKQHWLLKLIKLMASWSKCIFVCRMFDTWHH